MENGYVVRKNNIQFCILSALAITFVVDGHLGHSYFDLDGLFQYYSFHMQLFVFISGYFFQLREQEQLHSYIIRKFQKLMIPYFVWNLIYGLTAQLLRTYGFGFGEPVTFETLFLEPFRMGYQFTLNHAAWFVPALFLVEIVNAVFTSGIKLLIQNKKTGDWLIFAAYMLLGIGGICLSGSVGTEGWMLPLIRTMFLLPFYHAGTLYRMYLEEKDRLPNLAYFGITAAIALVLNLSGRRLIYAVSDCGYFDGYLLPYITAFVGIAFWLRISRTLVPVFENSRLVQFLGRNTSAVMMHHMMVFLIIKTGYVLMNRFWGLFADLDYAAYKTDIYYCYYPEGKRGLVLVYLLAGILIPLAFRKIQNRITSGNIICKRC